ncbi:MAG: DUF4252 domain-containing protein [Bacteroidales bacterium]|jgi:hypothetical protein|nr:DUF4252 domain-containing protein [Bacteroidales bacterium]MDD2831778.1 DUF4252 domain-containing protein [Bacteroidales bacterium]MDD3209422.1 DUF4252 domain-containing protein [Bacteroidales bacterium]MDD3697772.1 DUF4252 domain-containing protein [Bacteroidales bacterium]MDD4168101.1 DUF4252 domain-containing protein [Bacteroidales bacterium]
MKKIFLTIMLVAGNILVSYAQRDIQDIILQFSMQPRVEHIHVGSLAMKLAQAFASEEDAPFIKGIRSVTVLSLENCDENVKNAFRKQAGNIHENGLELLVEVTDESDEVRILAEIRKDMIKRFIVISVGEDPYLIQINGHIDMSYMEELVSQNTKDI